MPKKTTSILTRLVRITTIAVGLYAVLLGILLTPSAQRFALYAHKINTLFLGDDLSEAEQFGFAKHQVTPFNLSTPDGETLFGWHILPLDVYVRNEKTIGKEQRAHGPVEDFTSTTAYRFLKAGDSEPARLLITCESASTRPSTGLSTD